MKKLTSMPAAVLACMVASLTLGGCAARQQPLYYWGNYQSEVYAYFKGETGPEDQILALEADRERARAEGKALPPGFDAQLGLLYGKTGRTDQLVKSFDAEKARFPEGAAYMDFLLKHQKQPAANGDAK